MLAVPGRVRVYVGVWGGSGAELNPGMNNRLAVCAGGGTLAAARRLIFSHVIRSAGSTDGSLNRAANDFLMLQRTRHLKGRGLRSGQHSALINDRRSAQVACR